MKVLIREQLKIRGTGAKKGAIWHNDSSVSCWHPTAALFMHDPKATERMCQPIT